MPLLALDGVSKRFGGIAAVDQVSFQVDRGQVVGFLGPNGAGKSTTMRMITQFIEPDTGAIRLDGVPLDEAGRDAKRRIGYLPENNPLYPEMLASEYLDFVGRLRELAGPSRQRAIDEAVAATSLEPVFHRPIGELSKGFRQRVGLAAAILHNPDVLILDEPTAGLDPKQIIETRELIKSLGGDHTIVLSTHILPEVSMTCGRVVIISKGRVVAEDTPDNLTHRLQGAGGFRLEVRGEGPALEDALRAVPGVIQVRLRSVQSGVSVLEAEAEAGRDVRADLAATVIQKGYGLLGLAPVGMSLEEIFLLLTTTDTTEAAAAAPAPPASPEVTA
jgi:gliding motility-associated transport system ATP-binding protein